MSGPPKNERVLARFNRLMRDLRCGVTQRNTFRPWEVDIILDVTTSKVNGRSLWEILRQYQRAVQLHMAKGPSVPLKFSTFMKSIRSRRKRRKANMWQRTSIASRRVAL